MRRRIWSTLCGHLRRSIWRPRAIKPERAFRTASERLEPRLVLDGGLVISELLAINGGGGPNNPPGYTALADEDGDFSDWIEIHNPTAQDVNLEGWHLSDDADDLDQWTFPAKIIMAGDHLVVFASDKDRTDPAAPLHTNFKLDGGGEFLALVAPDGQSIASQFDPEFPRQLSDVSYGIGDAVTTNEELVGEGSSARILVPTNDDLALSWTGAAADEPFVDGAWRQAFIGVGYDTQNGGPLAGAFETDVQQAMFGNSSSLYVRAAFEVADPQQLSTLTLRMQYDDGFVAYLNGQRIASRNAPASLDDRSAATADRPAAQAVVFEEFDVSDHAGLLRLGSNILAIHGLNDSALSSDFLISPELLTRRTITSPLEYFTTPTPGETNIEGGLGLVADTQFNFRRGFYSEPIDVEITTDTPGAEIRYTLDGSKPTATFGHIYQEPIHIETTTTLRAAAFMVGSIPTNVDTQTYLYLDDVLRQDGSGLPPHANWGHAGGGGDWAVDPDIVNHAVQSNRLTTDDLRSVPTLSLVLPWADMFGSGGQGIYISGKGREKAVSIEQILPDGSTGFQIDGSVEIQGGSSTGRWKADKLSMQLTFKEPYGPTKLKADIFGEEATDRFDTFILDAVLNFGFHHPSTGQTAFAKFIQDQFVANVQNAMGGYAPRARYHHLYINGLYWGMYYVHERPDESFAEAYLGGDKEDYDVLKHTRFTVVNGSSSHYNNVLVARAGANLSSSAAYNAVAEVLDIPNLIDYMITNFYAGNDDWAHHNWYASRDRVTPGAKWRFHSWDAEHVLKSTTVDLTERGSSGNNFGAPTWLHTRLRANAEYRQLFADRVQKHFFNDGILTKENAAAEYQKLMDEIDRAIVGETARWGDNRVSRPYTRDDWLRTQNGLLDNYFPVRSNNVLGQLRNDGLYPNSGGVQPPSFNQHGGEMAEGFRLAIDRENASGTIYFTTDGSDPRLTGGAVNNDSAQVYSGAPVLLERSTLVKARVRRSGSWSPLVEAEFLSPPVMLSLSEIHFNPAAADEGDTRDSNAFEFIEFFNHGQATIDTRELRLVEGVDFDFSTGSVSSLEPGQRMLVVRDVDAFSARYPNVDANLIAGPFVDSGLKNGGETIRLAAAFDQTVFELTYDNKWYGLTDGDGFSLVRRDANDRSADPNLRETWRASNDFGGSPGAPDVFSVSLPEALVINEALAHTDAAPGDRIELLNNTTDETIDISGWFLSDDSSHVRKFQIPNRPPLAPGEMVVFDGLGAGGFSVGGAAGVIVPFALSELGDKVVLHAATAGGDLLGYREDIDFGASDREVAFGRYVKSTGGKDIVAMSENTFGDPNALPVVGPIVIHEIMYSPAAGGRASEFIELRNITGEAVSLAGWKIGGGIDFVFPTFPPEERITIPAGGLVLLTPTEPSEFLAGHGVPAGAIVVGPYDGSLENNGESITLRKPGEPEPDGSVPMILVDRIRYNNQQPWPPGADGDGPALQRREIDQYGNDPINWTLSFPGGTPGDFAVPPQVTEVLVRGSDWSDEFLARLAAEGAGEGGFSIRGGAAQLQTLPWQNIDQLIVRFSEEVNVFQSDLKLLGVNAAAIKVADFDDDLPRSATWTFSAPLKADKLLLVLSDAITDVSGFPLDGNWSSGDTLPSGNGAIDNDDAFRFRFTVLPGDAIADAAVSRGDLIDQIHGLGSIASDAGYDIRLDINADGQIDLADVRSLLLRIGTTLPSSEPNESSGANALSNRAVSSRSRQVHLVGASKRFRKALWMYSF
ncbi:MAG: lamin tail domain-containing protein, partial [Planctomycetes bacterium]|nr:lamin tail domain-containing protein [Planctomycetota bacterium]